MKISINIETLQEILRPSESEFIFYHKLYHLECSKVFFPPEVFSVLRTERGQPVVKVHDKMNQ